MEHKLVDGGGPEVDIRGRAEKTSEELGRLYQLVSNGGVAEAHHAEYLDGLFEGSRIIEALTKRLAFADLLKANVDRAALWHAPGTTPWNIADWSNATAGEGGEQMEAVLDLLALVCATNAKLGAVANAIKKARRHETGVSQASGPQTIQAAIEAVKNEIGDVTCYLDLLAHACGLRLEDCIRDTFNRVSDRENMPVRL